MDEEKTRNGWREDKKRVKRRQETGEEKTRNGWREDKTQVKRRQETGEEKTRNGWREDKTHIKYPTSGSVCIPIIFFIDSFAGLTVEKIYIWLEDFCFGNL
jgi:ribosomal protein S8E